VSAAAVAASGMLELSTFVGTADSTRYRDSAISIIKGIWTAKYRGLATQASILNHATGDRPRSTEVDVGLIYADYYFMQALLRYQQYSNATVVFKPSSLPAKMEARMLEITHTSNDIVFHCPHSTGHLRIVDCRGRTIYSENARNGAWLHVNRSSLGVGIFYGIWEDANGRLVSHVTTAIL
jgi:hypothetical protein